MPDMALDQVGLQDIKRNRGWYIALGLLLLILGVVAIGSTYLLAKVSVIFLGWLLIVGGITQSVHAFWKERGWSGFFIDLMAGLLYAIAGALIIANPKMAALTLALMIAFFLIFEGLFRIVAAIAVRYPNWAWMLLHGVVSLALGVMIWSGWPATGLRVIGLFVGIHIIMNGWTTLMLGLAAKHIPDEAAE